MKIKLIIVNNITAIFSAAAYKQVRGAKTPPENRKEIITMNANAMMLNINRMEEIRGGTVNKNPSPSKMDPGIDQIINGKNYDWIAQQIADWLNGDNNRTREVNNQVDIYDTEI